MTTAMNIETASRRCWNCHRWYWWDTHGSPTVRCPCCAEQEIESLNRQLALAELSKRALRGVITRLKRRLGAG